MDKELRKIKELAEAKARQTQFYKRLTRRTYRRIKGYIDYKQIAVELASHLMCLETGFELRGFSDSA
jgi:GTP cyclohydrolase I